MKIRLMMVTGLLLSGMMSAAGETPEGNFIDVAKIDQASQLKPQDAKVSLAEEDGQKVIKVELGTESQWPGVTIYPPNGKWDLAAFKGVQAVVRNDSNINLSLALRVDNQGADGNKNCNTETAKVGPGKECRISVTFGKSWGGEGAKIDPSKIIALLLFSGKNREPAKVTIKSISGFTKIPEKAAQEIVDPERNKWVKSPGYPTKLDFETGEKMFDLEGGELTKDPNEVIDGTCSLVGDSRNKNRTWFEFFTTRPGLLEPGYEYTTRFRYRVMARGDKLEFYGLLRSLGQGWGQWDRGWTDMKDLPEDPGKICEGVLKIGITTFKDYQLMLGINGDARIIIDDIIIEKGAPYQEKDREQEAIVAIPKEAVVVDTIDFESDSKNIWLQNKNDIQSDPKNVIDGKHSLLLDSMGAKGQWNTRLAIQPDVFQGGGRFHIYLKTRALEWKNNNCHAYIVVKRADGGKSEDIVWKRWRGPVGVDRDTYLTFDLPEGQKAKLDLAIFNQGKMLADDIVVRREPLPIKAIDSRKPLVCTDDNLVWREEFDGGTLDPAKWNISNEPRTGGWWSKNNVSIKDGFLDLKFSKEPDFYAMGAINTAGKYTFKYGYVEARMKLPKQVGHWPGVWIIAGSVNKVGNGGKDGVEVDIVECPWRDKDRASHALHWDGYSLDHQSLGKQVDIPGLNEGWHTYAVDWSPAGYIFFVDGKETWRTDAGGSCEVPLHIILSDEKGGWSGNPDNAKDLPDHTYIDYIRVWQKK